MLSIANQKRLKDMERKIAELEKEIKQLKETAKRPGRPKKETQAA